MDNSLALRAFRYLFGSGFLTLQSIADRNDFKNYPLNLCGYTNLTASEFALLFQKWRHKMQIRIHYHPDDGYLDHNGGTSFGAF